MHDSFKRVRAEEAVSKPGTILGIGIGMGLYERHSKQELINFDPGPDSDARCVSYVNEVHRYI